MFERLSYLVGGLTGRLRSRQTCPCCDRSDARVVDRKFFHALLECGSCKILHRYPVETSSAMAEMYQNDYVQAGLTTDLPDEKTLKRLLETSFSGTEKDFSNQVAIFRALGLSSGSRVLDFGANWGYASWQFSEAGFSVESYELAKTRARYGENLGIKIETDTANLKPGFDIVYSSHVLEHTPDPADALRVQMSLVRPGGFVIGHTPNGNLAYQAKSPRAFHLSWGKVHPVLLTPEFIQHVAQKKPCLIASVDTVETVGSWDRASQIIVSADGPALFFVICVAA